MKLAPLPTVAALVPREPWIAPGAPDDPQYLHRAAAIASDGTVYVAAGSLLHEFAPDGSARDTRRLPWTLAHRGMLTVAGPRLVVWGAGRTLVLDRKDFVVRVLEHNAVAALSASGRRLALGPFSLSSAVSLTVFDLPDVGPPENPYPPPVPRGGHPLWVGENRDLMFAHGGAWMYRYARDVSEQICAGGAGEFIASADGETLAYVTHSRATFHAVAARRLRGMFKQSRWSIALGPHGRIAVRDCRGRVFRFVPECGERRLLGVFPGREGTLHATPDGNQLVACASDEARVAVIVDADVVLPR